MTDKPTTAQDELDWTEAYYALKARIQADPQFIDVVRGYHGQPTSVVPSSRARRVAVQICKRLDLNPAIYIGNVYGAAADYIIEKGPQS